jgi:hypothetical protein
MRSKTGVEREARLLSHLPGAGIRDVDLEHGTRRPQSATGGVSAAGHAAPGGIETARENGRSGDVE